MIYRGNALGKNQAGNEKIRTAQGLEVWFKKSGFSLIYFPLGYNSPSRGKGARLVYGQISQSLDMSHLLKGTRSITRTSLSEVALINLAKRSVRSRHPQDLGDRYTAS